MPGFSKSVQCLGQSDQWVNFKKKSSKNVINQKGAGKVAKKRHSVVLNPISNTMSNTSSKKSSKKQKKRV